MIIYFYCFLIHIATRENVMICHHKKWRTTWRQASLRATSRGQEVTYKCCRYRTRGARKCDFLWSRHCCSTLEQACKVRVAHAAEGLQLSAEHADTSSVVRWRGTSQWPCRYGVHQAVETIHCHEEVADGAVCKRGVRYRVINGQWRSVNYQLQPQHNSQQLFNEPLPWSSLPSSTSVLAWLYSAFFITKYIKLRERRAQSQL